MGHWNKGITLIELVVVISIISILTVALGFEFIGWQGRYNVERTTKDIYTDLMDARTRAMMRNRAFFVDFLEPTGEVERFRQYRISADTAAVDDWAADGDRLYDADGDGNLDAWHTILPTFPKTLGRDYSIVWGNNPIVFNKRGTITPNDTLCIDYNFEADPDYDCITISRTRINLGELAIKLRDGGACNAANCAAK
ncbi:MAG: GspH/FimT family pseudopilin [Nitrospirota bacterium]|nr:GspH/FimT family pseudopilin [Nitrospirota bacterium]